MYDLYLAQYTHKYGNGYAIIGARNAEQVSSILKNQGRFKDAIIVACKKIELPTPPDGDMQLMIEGAVTTIGNSAYDIAVSLGYRGTKEEWLESMKGPKGDPGPMGSYIAGKGIDITDGVISVIESGGSKVSYTPNITEGTKLGTLNIDDKNYNIYSPTPIDAYTKNETDDLLDTKQGTLIAGDNITIVNNVISSQQAIISAGDGIDITNNVVSVDNTIAKKTDVYTKTETDSLLNNKQNTLSAGTGINITNNTVTCTVDISGKEDKAVLQTFTDNASLTLVDNTIYTASEAITVLTILDSNGTSVVSFNTAASGTITVTLPQSIIFADTPAFNNNEHWEIAIRNGYAVYSKFDLV